MTVRRAAGWYDDEQDAALQRYWDGASWTPHTTPNSVDETSGPVVSALEVAPARHTAVSSSSIPGFASAPSFTSLPSFAPAPAFGFAPPGPEGSRATSAAMGAAASSDDEDALDIPDTEAPEATSIRPVQAPAGTGDAAEQHVTGADDHSDLVSATLRMPHAPSEPIGHPAAPSEHTTAPLPPNDGRASASARSTVAATPGDRSFLLTWLFALLLGSLGVDRFYLGKVGTGVAKLVTAGGLGVWTLVDLVLVLIGAQHDRDGRALTGYEDHRRLAWIVSGVLVAFSMLAGIGISLAIMANLMATLGVVGSLR